MASTMVALLFLAGVVVCAQSAVTPDVEAKIRESVSKCASEHNVKPSEVQKQWRENTLPDTKDVNCYLECGMKAMGFIVGGKFNLENMWKAGELKWKNDQESVDKVKKIQAKCVADVNASSVASECGAAHHLSTCISKEIEKQGMDKSEW